MFFMQRKVVSSRSEISFISFDTSGYPPAFRQAVNIWELAHPTKTVPPLPIHEPVLPPYKYLPDLWRTGTTPSKQSREIFDGKKKRFFDRKTTGDLSEIQDSKETDSVRLTLLSLEQKSDRVKLMPTGMIERQSAVCYAHLDLAREVSDLQCDHAQPESSIRHNIQTLVQAMNSNSNFGEAVYEACIRKNYFLRVNQTRRTEKQVQLELSAIVQKSVRQFKIKLPIKEYNSLIKLPGYAIDASSS